MKNQPTLEELLQGITDENRPAEWETGPAVEREITESQQPNHGQVDSPPMPLTDSLWPLRSVTFAFLGSIGGAVSAGLIWDFLYGIGSSAITDEFYSANTDTVRLWGAVAGGCSGFALGLLRDRSAIGAFLLTQFLSLVAGMMAAPFGWKAAVETFPIVHAIAAAASLFWLLFKTGQKVRA